MNSYLLVVRAGAREVAQGTGWLVRETVVVTAFHVVGLDDGTWRHEDDDEVRYYLRVDKDHEYPLTHLERDADADIAILALAAEAQDLSILRLADVPPQGDDRWRSRGFPGIHGEATYTVSGTVTDVQGDRLQLFIEQDTQVSWKGFSGAPVCNQNNEVIAVVGRETDRASTLWAAHVEAVRRLLRRVDEPRTASRARPLRRTTAQPRISWLHIADLHRGPHSRWPDLRDAALRDLARHAESHGPPDLILATGDLSDSGTDAEFEKVTHTIDDIRKVLGGDPVVVPVPGNHDLARPNPANPAATGFRGYRKNLETRALLQHGDADSIAPLNRWFAAYADWLEGQLMPEWRRQGVVYEPGLLPGDVRLSLEVRGLRLGIVGVNSAFLQLDDQNHRGELILERQQAGADLSAWIERHHAALLLMHHPPEWLAERDDFCESIYRSDRFVACLFGHAWELPRDPAEERDGRRRLWVQAPSLFGRERCDQERKERPHGYVWGQLDQIESTRGRLRLWRRKAERTDGCDIELVPRGDEAHRPAHTWDVALRDVREPAISRRMVGLSPASLERLFLETSDTALAQAQADFRAGRFADALEAIQDLRRKVERLDENPLVQDELRSRWFDARLYEAACQLDIQKSDEAGAVLLALDKDIQFTGEDSYLTEDRRILMAQIFAQTGNLQRARALLEGLPDEATRDTRQLLDIREAHEIPQDLTDDVFVRLNACDLRIMQGAHGQAAREALQVIAILEGREPDQPRRRMLLAYAVQVLLAAMSQSIHELPRGCTVVAREERTAAVAILQRYLALDDSPLQGAVPARDLARWITHFHYISWDVARVKAARERLRALGENDSAYRQNAPDVDPPEALALPDALPAWARVPGQALRLERDGQLDKALAMVEQAIAEDPERPRPLLERAAASLLLAKGQPERAGEHAERAFRGFPGHGQAITWAETLYTAGKARRIWDELREQLEGSPNRPARRLLAWSASQVAPAEAPDYWEDIVSASEGEPSFAENAFDRLEWARSLAQVGRTGEAAEQAWRAFRSGRIAESVDALMTCAELQWDTSRPERDQRLRALAKELWAHADLSGDHLARAGYFELWERLGQPSDLPRPDFEQWHKDGALIALSRDQVESLWQTVTAHRRQIELAYVQGWLPLELFAREARIDEAELFERIRRAQGVLRTPILDAHREPVIENHDVLLGVFELLLFDHLELLPALEHALGEHGRVLLFEDVYLRIISVPGELASRTPPHEQERMQALSMLLATMPDVWGPEDADGEQEAQWAERQDAVLVRVRGQTAPARSLGEWIRWLHRQGHINAGRVDTFLGPSANEDEGTGEASITDFDGRTIALDFTALRVLVRAGMARELIEASRGQILITPHARHLLSEHLTDLEIRATASQRARRIRSWVIELEKEHRLERIERPSVALPPPHDAPEAQERRQWFEQALSWREALHAHPDVLLLSADALCAEGVTDGDPPVPLFEALKERTAEQWDELHDRLESVTPRVGSLAAVCRALAEDGRRDEILASLALLGFVDAFEPEDLLRHAEAYGGLSGARPRAVLDKLATRAHQSQLVDWMRIRMHLAVLYAKTIERAWCGPVPATRREDLTTVLLDRSLALDSQNQHSLGTLRWLFRYLCAYACDNPLTSFIEVGERAQLSLEKSKAGAMWRAVAHWMTEQSEPQRWAAYGIWHQGATACLLEAEGNLQGKSDLFKLVLGPLAMAAEALRPFDNQEAIPPGTIDDAIAVLSALWPDDMKPFAAAHLIAPRGNIDAGLSLEEGLVRAARISVQSPGRIHGDGISIWVPVDEQGSRALACSPAALFLRMRPEERAALAEEVIWGWGPDDGRIVAPLLRIASAPENGEALHAYAHMSVQSPWQMFRLHPETILQWGNPTEARLFPTSIAELRALLSEPGPLPTQGALHEILHERVEEGTWKHRADRIALLDRCGELLGVPRLPLMWRVPAQDIEIAKSRRRLADASNQPAARIAFDLLISIVAGEEAPAKSELRAQLAGTVLAVLQQAIAEPPSDSLAACEPQLLQHAMWAVRAIRLNSAAISSKDQVWLTWCLYQWMIRQLENLPEEEKKRGWQRLAAVSPERSRFSWNPQPVFMEPSRFGRGRLDIRLLAILHVLAIHPPARVRWLMTGDLRRLLDELRQRPLTPEEQEVATLPAPVFGWGNVPRTVPELADFLMSENRTKSPAQSRARKQQRRAGSSGKKRPKQRKKRR